MKNREMTKVVPLKIEINEYKKQLEAAVTDLNGMDMFLGYDQLVKHNLEVNWKNRTIKFTKCPGNCKMKHQDIKFNTRKTQTTETMAQNNSKIGKKLDKTNPENLPEYIQPFTHLFNKKKFKKLLEQCEQDHKINLIKKSSKRIECKGICDDTQERRSIKPMAR